MALIINDLEKNKVKSVLLLLMNGNNGGGGEEYEYLLIYILNVRSLHSGGNMKIG